MLHSVPDKPWRQFASGAPGSALVTVLLAVVVVSALYFGREVLVPIALAILLSFVLAPLVRLLQACYVPRILAVMFAVAVAFVAIFVLGGLMISQVNQLAKNLPHYESTLRDKIQSLRGAAAGTGTLERASEVLHDLSSELDRPNRVSPSTGPLVSPGTSTARPIPVEIKQPDPGALQTLAALITPLIHPLATTGIVAIFVFFVLMQRQDLRNRLVRLAGSQDLQRTTAALDDAGQRLSRLFLTQLALNAGFGLVIGAGLWFVGVPSAPVGNTGDDPALCALHRSGDFRDISSRPRGSGRAGLDNGVVDCRFVFDRGAACRACHRAVADRSSHGSFTCRGHRLCHVLGLALGTGGADSGDAADDLPRGSRPPCGSPEISRCDVWGPACAIAGRVGLSTRASAGPRRGSRAGAEVPEGEATSGVLPRGPHRRSETSTGRCRTRGARPRTHAAHSRRRRRTCRRSRRA